MAGKPQSPKSPRRRAFLAGSVATVGTLGSVGSGEARQTRAGNEGGAQTPSERAYNGPYQGEHLSRVAFPLGGMGAGMICLEGTGALSHVSLRNQPDVFNEPCVFAAICVKGAPNLARVLEGPVPGWKLFGPRTPATAAAELPSACRASAARASGPLPVRHRDARGRRTFR